uniref:Protein regulator of cytokinesis 1a n=1 Tax=Monopterus albus TaxID=43700 RepID=A0A3Q3JKB1_MONAL
MRLSEVHATKSVAYFNRTMARLQSIWEEIGIPEEQRLNRTKAVHKHIKGLLDLMIDEEEALKEKLEKNIEINHKELSKLCSELQLPPFEEEVGYTMLQKEKNSRTHLEVMEQHRRQRMEELKDFIVKDYKLCDIMRTTPFSVDHDAVPSLKQLETYRAYIDDLTKEKDRCHDEFMSIKKDIVVCMDDLEQQPETSFEMDVMYGDEEAFCLSNDNMSALKLLLNQVIFLIRCMVI